MTIQTSQDAVVIYTMNSQQKKNTYMGKLPPIRHGICFETQAPPIGKDMCFIDRSILKENEQSYRNFILVRWLFFEKI